MGVQCMPMGVQCMLCQSAITAVDLLRALCVSIMAADHYFGRALLCKSFMCLIRPSNCFLYIQLFCTNLIPHHLTAIFALQV